MCRARAPGGRRAPRDVLGLLPSVGYRLVAKGFETRPKGGRATPPCPAPAKGATRGRRADSVARAAEAFTGSQPHARNSVASLRLTRLPEPRSVIELLFLLRYYRPAKSPPSSLGKQTLRRSRLCRRLSRVCSTLCRVVHPSPPHRRAARPPQHAPARRSLFRQHGQLDDPRGTRWPGLDALRRPLSSTLPVGDKTFLAGKPKALPAGCRARR